MDWQSGFSSLAGTFFNKTAALAGTFGLGGGVGIVKLLYHMPAPPLQRIWSGGIFDTLQDLVSNKDRIGERRLPDGEITFIQKPQRAKDIV